MKKYVLFFLLFALGCTGKVELNEGPSQFTQEVSNDGIFTNQFCLDKEFENVNLPYWWSSQFIDSLGIKRIEINRYRGNQIRNGIDYSIAIPAERITFKFNKEGDVRSILKQNFYDDILIDSKEYQMLKRRETGYVEVKQKVFSKYKKRHFYNPTLESSVKAYLEPLQGLDSIFKFKGNKKEVLMLAGNEEQLHYFADSLGKNVWVMDDNFTRPNYKILFHQSKIDTIERNYYNSLGAITFQLSEKDKLENRVCYAYANNTLSSIVDSLYIEDEFVSVMKYEMHFDSINLPFQILMKEQLKNNNEELLEIYTLKIDR